MTRTTDPSLIVLSAKDGRFVGAFGDALLFPVPGRLPMGRVFCFGAGKRSALDETRFAALVRRGCEAMTLAGSKAVAAEIPELAKLEPAARARAFIAEGATKFRGERIVLLGDGRALVHAFQDAGGQMKALEIDRDVLGALPVVVAVAPPPRAAQARTARA